jgi:hypothetical protein
MGPNNVADNSDMKTIFPDGVEEGRRVGRGNRIFEFHLILINPFSWPEVFAPRIFSVVSKG